MEKGVKDISDEIVSGSLAERESMSADFSKIDGSCYYSHITTEMSSRLVDFKDSPFKVAGNVIVILVKGKLHVELSTDSTEIEGPAAVSLNHGSLVNFRPGEGMEIDAHVLIYTPAFLHDINIYFSSISVDALVSHDSPVMDLREREVTILLRYVSLINHVMSDRFNNQLNRHIVSALTSALFYQMMLFIYRRIDTGGVVQNGPRRNSYVQDFLKLVHMYYTTERAVAFYASKLFISPKYLSLLVKEATGRSAACWIDHFVIMEAKNLLRYSGKNVQQVAYSLNFSNQSSFGKYFKHLTGMSPTDFQKQS